MKNTMKKLLALLLALVLTLALAACGQKEVALPVADGAVVGQGAVAFTVEVQGADGKTVTFTIKVNKIQTSQKPEVNEEFAKKVGQESLEKMKASIIEHVSATKAQAARSEAMKKLIDGLLEKVSFEIPESMLNARVERVVQEQAMKLQRMGIDDLRKDQAQEEKREEAKKEALETLRPQVFLMALAQKENITVSDQEVEMAIYGMAMRAQQDYKKVSEAYHKSGLIYELRDRILADKALELVYSKAKINEVPAVSLSAPKNAD